MNTKPSKEQLINQAIKFHQAGNILEATKYYQSFINQGFKDHKVFSNYGLILKNLGKLKEAEISTRKGIQLNPNFAIAHNNLGIILKDLGKSQEAEISYRKAIELNPNFVEAHSNLGNILKNLGKLKEAEVSYRKALELKPDFADANSNLGGILSDIGKLKEAEKYCQKAIQIKPDHAMAHYNTGNIFKKFDKLEEAEKYYQKAIQIKPNHANAHINLGNIYRNNGSLKKAEKYYQKAIQIKPNHADAHINLGIVFKELGKLKEGELSIRKAIQIKPDYADAHLNLGIVLKDLGKLKEGELSIRKAIQINPNYSRAYYVLSLLILDVVNDNQLKYLFSEEILRSDYNILNLNKADIYFARGIILERKKDYKESYKMFRQANIMTSKEFKSNFTEFKKALEIDNLSTQKIEHISQLGNKDDDLPTPIFTVGLPRAGKSTVESILSTNKLLIKFGDRKGISEVIRDYKNIEKSFQILGISKKSTYRDIRSAYLRLSKQFHPDKGGDKEMMAKIIEGYNFLENEYKKKAKDYRRPNLYKFFIQKLGEDIDSSHFTCHTSPNNILHAGVIASQIKKSKIIYCYRNPKDHIVELYKYNLKNYLPLKTSIIDLAKIIVIIDNQMEEYKNRFDSKIYFLNFDQMILNPKREIKSLINWLNWKYDDKYLTPKLMPKGIIKSKYDMNNFNSSYINNSENYSKMLQPIEGIFSQLQRNMNN
tara:strand:- start:325 stop:2457 length:2133 start_codon:yes stop_codon:yes gene_type:complete